jgi:hypothetical protein
MRSSKRILRLVPTFLKGSLPSSNKDMRNGRETFNKLAASCVVSSAWIGIIVMAFPAGYRIISFETDMTFRPGILLKSASLEVKTA